MKSIKANGIVCIENLLNFDGYIVPLLDPNEMLLFAEEANIHVTFDTTHYAQCNIDICNALSILKNRIKTVHLSDYIDGKSHVFLGDGCLDFTNFAKGLNLDFLHSITIECGIPFDGKNYDHCIAKCKQAKTFVEKILEEATEGEEKYSI